jgi:hypothetical protein
MALLDLWMRRMVCALSTATVRRVVELGREIAQDWGEMLDKNSAWRRISR